MIRVDHSGGNASIFGGDIKSHCGGINFHLITRLILNYYFYFVISLFVGLEEEGSLHRKGGYTRRIPRSHFACCCLQNKREEQLRRTTRDLNTHTHTR